MIRVLDKIDIIITTKNRISELLFTIDHLLNIGVSQQQVFIIDDGSEDNTYTIISEKYSDINIVRNDQSKGYIVNRNVLMEWSRNSYVLSLDDDSHIRTKDDIVEAISILENNPNYGIFHFRPFEQIALPPEKKELSSDVRILRNFIGCGHIISRETIESVGLYKEELIFYTEELDFSARAFIKGIKTVTKDDIVVHHRIDKTVRKKQKSSAEKDGVYGQTFRFKLIFSNNLMLTSIYYPFLIRQFFLLYRVILNFKVMAIDNENSKAWKLGLKRYFSMRSYILKERNTMSLIVFRAWFKLPLL